MKTWQAILFTLGLLIVMWLGSFLVAFATAVIVGGATNDQAQAQALAGTMASAVFWIMILGTALWAALDSRKIELRKYKSGIAYGPIVLFIACSLLWIIGFPWYLSSRYKIKNGLAELKDAYKAEAAPS